MSISLLSPMPMHLMSHVSLLLSLVSHLVSHVSLLLSLVSHLMSHASLLLSLVLCQREIFINSKIFGPCVTFVSFCLQETCDS